MLTLHNLALILNVRDLFATDPHNSHSQVPENSPPKISYAHVTININMFETASRNEKGEYTRAQQNGDPRLGHRYHGCADENVQELSSIEM